jgi:hypothetical protein
VGAKGAKERRLGTQQANDERIATKSVIDEPMATERVNEVRHADQMRDVEIELRRLDSTPAGCQHRPYAAW